MSIYRRTTKPVSKLTSLLMAALAGLAGLVSISAPASAAARLDLAIRNSTVTLSGNQVSGTFAVRNIGGRKARVSNAVLLVDLGTPIGRWKVRGLRAKRAQQIQIIFTVPAGTRAARLKVCADGTRRVIERSEYNNCTPVRTASVAGPNTLMPDQPMHVSTMDTTYWVNIPASYDRTGQTKMAAYVWLHGCESSAEKDIQSWISPPNRAFVSVAVGGRENQCFSYGDDRAWVMSVITDLVQRFNIDPHRVVLGGFSTGCVLAYRVGLLNSEKIAGIIGENCDPMKWDWPQTLAWSASRKLPLVQVGHTDDTQAAAATVTGSFNSLRDFGFPTTLTMRAGGYYDATTQSDLHRFGLNHMADGWLAPAGIS